MKGVSSLNNTNNKTGRNRQFSILYYNARSLILKFGDRYASVEICKPDIICIVETWLNIDISDRELAILGFQLYLKDTHQHGGGVLIYTVEFLDVCMLPQTVYDQSLEFLSLSVKVLDQKFCIAVFYRPPDSPISIFDTLFHSIELIDISQYSNFILVGDFDVDV